MPPDWNLPTSATCRKRVDIRGITPQRPSWPQSKMASSILPTTMLDERAKTLLKALVERYIADGQPVGSRTLSRACGLELSPATIRNVMADLEELGLIASPHTSAGRIPTARGYRLFVDTMLTAQPQRLPVVAARCGARGASARRPAAARDRQRGATAVEPVELRRRDHGAEEAERVPPHRVHAPVGAARAGDHRRARRRRAEPGHLHRPGLHHLAAAGGQQLPQRALRRPDHRGGARTTEDRGRRAAQRDRRADAGGRAGGQRRDRREPRAGGDRRRAQPAGGAGLLERHGQPAESSSTCSSRRRS